MRFSSADNVGFCRTRGQRGGMTAGVALFGVVPSPCTGARRQGGSDVETGDHTIKMDPRLCLNPVATSFQSAVSLIRGISSLRHDRPVQAKKISHSLHKFVASMSMRENCRGLTCVVLFDLLSASSSDHAFNQCPFLLRSVCH